MSPFPYLRAGGARHGRRVKRRRRRPFKRISDGPVFFLVYFLAVLGELRQSRSPSIGASKYAPAQQPRCPTADGETGHERPKWNLDGEAENVAGLPVPVAVLVDDSHTKSLLPEFNVDGIRIRIGGAYAPRECGNNEPCGTRHRGGRHQATAQAKAPRIGVRGGVFDGSDMSEGHGRLTRR